MLCGPWVTGGNIMIEGLKKSDKTRQGNPSSSREYKKLNKYNILIVWEKSL